MARVNLVINRPDGSFVIETPCELAGVPSVGDEIMFCFHDEMQYGEVTDRWWVVSERSPSVSVEITLADDSDKPNEEWRARFVSAPE